MVENLYTKRYSDRKMTEVRVMKAKVGVVPSADGSAIFVDWKN